jgi:hypothetical protein
LVGVCEVLVTGAALLAQDRLERSRRLAEKAEVLALTITDPFWQTKAWTDIAGALAEHHPQRARRALDRAEHLARTDTERPAEALARVAGAAVDLHDTMAARLAEEAEHLARSLVDPRRNDWQLGYLARALAHVDPDRAEAVARWITEPDLACDVLDSIALTLASTDPNRAIRLVREAGQLIPDGGSTRQSLLRVLAHVDPRSAEARAREIADPYQRRAVLTTVACALARTDPQRSLRLADTAAALVPREADSDLDVARALAAGDVVTLDFQLRYHFGIANVIRGDHRPETLVDIAGVLIETDAGQVEDLVHQLIDDPHRQISGYGDISRSVSGVTAILAEHQPDRARRVATMLLRTRFWFTALPAIAILRPDGIGAIAAGWPSPHTGVASGPRVGQVWRPGSEPRWLRPLS